MPTIPPLHRFVTTLMLAFSMAAASALAGQAGPAGAVPAFQLAGRTDSGDEVWAERCGPDAAAPALRATRVAWRPPQPDPGALSALMSALRRGDFESTGVRVVETDNGPMLRLAGTGPGAPDTFFMLCHVALHTSYD